MTSVSAAHRWSVVFSLPVLLVDVCLPLRYSLLVVFAGGRGGGFGEGCVAGGVPPGVAVGPCSDDDGGGLVVVHSQQLGLHGGQVDDLTSAVSVGDELLG